MRAAMLIQITLRCSLPSPPVLRGRGVGVRGFRAFAKTWSSCRGAVPPSPYPLGFTTNVRASSKTGHDAFEFGPAAPQGQPTRKAVAFAILMAAEASDMHVEREHCWISFQPA